MITNQVAVAVVMGVDNMMTAVLWENEVVEPNVFTASRALLGGPAAKLDCVALLRNPLSLDAVAMALDRTELDGPYECVPAGRELHLANAGIAQQDSRFPLVLVFRLDHSV
jgi:hypothetical protein